MSFWDNVKKFAQPYADDDYDDDGYDDYDDDYEEPEEEAPRRTSNRRSAPAPVSEPVSAPIQDSDDDFSFGSAFSGTTTTPAPASASTATPGFSGRVVSTGSVSAKKPTNPQRVVLFRPDTFENSNIAGEELSKNNAVVVNVENVDKAVARRVVDFLSGCVFAVGGEVKKIASGAYLFCPPNVVIEGTLDAIHGEVEEYC